MTDLRVSAVSTAIELAVPNDSSSDASADNDADKALRISSGPPQRLRQRASIGIVFHGDVDVEFANQPFGERGSPPAAQQFGFADRAGTRIDGASATNPDARNGFGDTSLKVAKQRYHPWNPSSNPCSDHVEH